MSDLIWASVMKSVGDESSGVCQSIVIYSAGKSQKAPQVSPRSLLFFVGVTQPVLLQQPHERRRNPFRGLP